jgi:hypothetical protein
MASELDLLVDKEYWKNRYVAQVNECEELRKKLLRLELRFQEEPDTVAAYVDSAYRQKYDQLKLDHLALSRKVQAIQEILK